MKQVTWKQIDRTTFNNLLRHPNCTHVAEIVDDGKWVLDLYVIKITSVFCISRRAHPDMGVQYQWAEVEND